MCKGWPWKALLSQSFPPIKVNGELSPRETTYNGQRYPMWQEIDSPLIHNEHVWAQADEFRVTVPLSMLTAEGWEDPVAFVRTWLEDLGGVPEKKVLRPDEQGHPSEGGKVFNSLLVCEKGTEGGGGGTSCEGCLLRCDLHDPEVKERDSNLVRAMDSEVVAIGWSGEGEDRPYFRVASVATVSDDGIPRRNPVNAVREFGAFLGEGSAPRGSASDGNSLSPVSSGAQKDPSLTTSRSSSGASHPPWNGAGLVTFYTRAVYAMDRGLEDRHVTELMRKTFFSFIKGIAERFGFPSDEAASMVRGFGGLDRTFTLIGDKPSCYKEQDGSLHADESQAFEGQIRSGM